MEEFSAKEVILAFGADDLCRELVRRNVMMSEGTSVNEISQAPFSPTFSQRHEQRLPMLTHNAISFSDQMEGLISENQLIQQIGMASRLRSLGDEAQQRHKELFRSQRILVVSYAAIKGISSNNKLPVTRKLTRVSP